MRLEREVEPCPHRTRSRAFGLVTLVLVLLSVVMFLEHARLARQERDEIFRYLAEVQIGSYVDAYRAWLAGDTEPPSWCPPSVEALVFEPGRHHDTDPWGRPYVMVCHPGNGWVTFVSSGPDGRFETADDLSEHLLAGKRREARERPGLSARSHLGDHRLPPPRGMDPERDPWKPRGVDEEPPVPRR